MRPHGYSENEIYHLQPHGDYSESEIYHLSTSTVWSYHETEIYQVKLYGHKTEIYQLQQYGHIMRLKSVK